MHYVIVGASAAGINAAKTLRNVDKNAKITLISKDEHIHSRCILHHYLEDKRDIEKLNFAGSNFIEKNRIDWIKGIAVESIDPTKQQLGLSNGDTVSYDKVLLATGGSTFFPPVTGLREAGGVIGFRNLDDAIILKEKAKEAKDIIIMGAGLVGIDALEGLLHYHKNLSLVEFKGHMLSIQLDPRAAKAYQDAFEAAGVKQYYGTAAEEVIMDDQGNIKALKLSTGETLPCDLLVVAAGVHSNVAFLENSGIECDKFGLLFDQHGKTNVENVYGAGDISGRMPIWPTATKEGIIAAYNMAGQPREMNDFFASKSTMNFMGIATMSLGNPDPADDSYSIEIQEKGDVYKKIIHKDGIIHGAILQNDLNYAGVLTQLIREKIDVSKVKKPLFEIDYSDFFHQTDHLQFSY